MAIFNSQFYNLFYISLIIYTNHIYSRNHYFSYLSIIKIKYTLYHIFFYFLNNPFFFTDINKSSYFLFSNKCRRNQIFFSNNFFYYPGKEKNKWIKYFFCPVKKWSNNFSIFQR